jgi:hypothetical protein
MALESLIYHSNQATFALMLLLQVYRLFTVYTSTNTNYNRSNDSPSAAANGFFSVVLE